MRVMDPSQQDSHTFVRMDSPMGRKVATRWYAHHPIQYNTGNHDILGVISTVIRASSGYILCSGAREQNIYMVMNV